MVVELSPAVYLALCGLVQDALQFPSDATHLLKLAAKELTNAGIENGFPANEQAEVEEEPYLRVASGG